MGVTFVGVVGGFRIYTSTYLDKNQALAYGTHCQNCGQEYNPFDSRNDDICWRSPDRKHYVGVRVISIDGVEAK